MYLNLIFVCVCVFFGGRGWGAALVCLFQIWIQIIDFHLTWYEDCVTGDHLNPVHFNFLHSVKTRNYGVGNTGFWSY